jgi:hypothetical protein
MAAAAAVGGTASEQPHVGEDRVDLVGIATSSDDEDGAHSSSSGSSGGGTGAGGQHVALRNGSKRRVQREWQHSRQRPPRKRKMGFREDASGLITILDTDEEDGEDAGEEWEEGGDGGDDEVICTGTANAHPSIAASGLAAAATAAAADARAFANAAAAAAAARGAWVPTLPGAGPASCDAAAVAAAAAVPLPCQLSQGGAQADELSDEQVGAAECLCT